MQWSDYFQRDFWRFWKIKSLSFCLNICLRRGIIVSEKMTMNIFRVIENIRILSLTSFWVSPMKSNCPFSLIQFITFSLILLNISFMKVMRLVLHPFTRVIKLKIDTQRWQIPCAFISIVRAISLRDYNTTPNEFRYIMLFCMNPCWFGSPFPIIPNLP